MHGNLYHKLYLQNHVETSTQNYSVITDIIAGKNVKPGETVGDYVIQSGANVVFHAGENIVFTDGFIAAEGSNFIAYVDPFFTCTHTTTAPPKGNNSEPVPVIESFSVEAINSLNSEEPVTEKEYYLKLYPNPSTGNVTIEYNLSKSELVEISLHDNFGKLVYNLKNRTPHDAGVYKITFNGVELPTGIYFCTLRTENGQKTEKLMIVR
ncbi:MAG: T9SS type A sorting domain-containing protein [Bacteroidetes bacterium]|nr:T9SS type A sorting domain-containing protein [Bacteroidota bacterium]MCL2303227.1 T9SS type A sorting domain-containing protein [Lentimicrobiaceae bacterium]